MQQQGKYTTVIGLEVHVQLATRTKLFCGDSILFNQSPNSQVSAISLAHPGSLPQLNRKAVEYAVRMGIACEAHINEHNHFARKNYFYPDLPKGYQVSQHTIPVCSGGHVEFLLNGEMRKVTLNRIHLEEDAGKSIHDADPLNTLIDLNRAGTPLIEIVTEPCIHSAEEADMFLQQIRKLVRWLGISDGNMEEGSLRCDANISLMPVGSSQLGTRVEVKNLNSFRFLRKAIEFEADRMTSMLDGGERIRQETRSFDPITGTTFAMRDKEEANDYRYFPDPDIAPFIISRQYVEDIRQALPIIPMQAFHALRSDYGLNEYDATQLIDDRSYVDMFFAYAKEIKAYKTLCNWIVGPIREYALEHQVPVSGLPVSIAELKELLDLVAAGTLSFSVAATKVFPLMIEKGSSPSQIVTDLGLAQVDDLSELTAWVDEVLADMPDKVVEFRKGKKGLMGLFVGEVKKKSRGKADARKVTLILEEKLKH